MLRISVNALRFSHQIFFVNELAYQMAAHAELQRLATNAVTLYALDDLHEACLPANSSLGTNRQNYHLPFSREKQLAEAFAFLAATTDDMKYVMAVAVEESESGESMIIRLASNSGDLGPIKLALQRIVTKLESIYRSSRCNCM